MISKWIIVVGKEENDGRATSVCRGKILHGCEPCHHIEQMNIECVRDKMKSPFG